MLENEFVNVFNSDSDDNCRFIGDMCEVVARVKFNSNLEYIINNWSEDSKPTTKGLTKLKTGEYVLIRGAQHDGQQNYGYIITKDEALHEILHSGRMELLELPEFIELKLLVIELENREIERL